MEKKLVFLHERKWFVTCVLVVLFFVICVAPNIAHGQAGSEVMVEVDIEIFEVDLSTDIARLNLTLSFINLNASESRFVDAIVSGEYEYAYVHCNSTNDDYVGSSGIVEWVLAGEVGKGEYAPFETYELRFTLTHLSSEKTELNPSVVKIDRLNSFCNFEGSKRIVLSQIFEEPSSQSPFWFFFPGDQEQVVYLRREVGAFGMPTLFWPLIAPTMICYFLLAGTLLINGKRNLGHRLVVYVALFIFGPTFFVAIQDYLPLRATLSIPEVLIEGLIISTAIYTIWSLASTRNHIIEQTRDGAMFFSSLFILSAILQVLMLGFPKAASPVFEIVFLGYSGFAVFIWSVKTWYALNRPPRNFLLALLSVAGIAIVDFSFLLASFAITQWIPLILGLVMGIVGILLLYWQHVQRTNERRRLTIDYLV